MKAVVFHKQGDIRVENVDDPKIEDRRDIILKVTSTAICGSDLHIYNGFFPQAKPIIMGHEFMGIVEEKGPAVRNINRGDRVIVPFPIACGQCYFCNNKMPTHCEHTNPQKYGPQGDMLNGKGGGIFGYTDLYGGYSGGQAEYVRVPFADVNPRKVNTIYSDEQLLFLTDIFPTGWAAIDWAGLRGGETVAIFGSGPVGLMAQKAAWLQNAGRVIAIDPLDYRLQKAKELNAVETINPHDVDPIETIRQMTNGRGADLCVDAVGTEAERNFFERVKAVINVEKGSPKVMENCFEAVRRGGTVSVVGLYGSNYDNYPVHRLFDKGLTLKFGQVPVQNYIDQLLRLVEEKKVVLEDIITHRVPLSKADEAYKLFRNKEDNCVKVVMSP